MKTRRSSSLFLAALVAVAGLAFTACGGGTGDSPDTTQGGGSTTTMGGHANGNTLHVIGTDKNGADNKFDPKELDLKAGETYTVEFENTGSVAHTFTIKDWDVDTGLVNPGDTEEVEFTVPADAASKSIKFVCIPHEALGMVGTINVS
ncbi:MAG: cupredoxin domain-containing protein [Acidimicrobiia bacterium]|nr:cupredoxin domain-containing protein [Acidimicrobiia bacterium]